MNLSKTERWILSNQYRILALLDPADAQYYDEAREAIERGYQRHYAWLTPYIDDDVLTDEEGKEIIDILEMFDMLQRAVGDGLDEISPADVRFPGFDGNNETKEMGYARYYCKADGGRFAGLRAPSDFNSHMPSTDRYRRQLAAWRASEDRHALTADDVRRIVDARIHPERATQ